MTWVILFVLGVILGALITQQERKGPHWVEYTNAKYKDETRRQRWITKYHWQIFAVVAMRYHRFRAQQLTTIMTDYDPGTKASLYGR